MVKAVRILSHRFQVEATLFLLMCQIAKDIVKVVKERNVGLVTLQIYMCKTCL